MVTLILPQDTPDDAVSGGRPGSAARSRSAGRARSGGHQADSRLSPATDEENSNIMLLLDAAEELHKTASHDGPHPSTAATHGNNEPSLILSAGLYLSLHPLNILSCLLIKFSTGKL